MKVPFGYVKISKKTRELVDKALKDGKLSQGENVEKFEEKFAKFVGTRYAVATSSGTAALTLMLAALDRDEKDEIIVPALTFPATWNAVVHNGYKLVPVDINDYTLNIELKKMFQKINNKTKAVLAVHLMGKPVDLHDLQLYSKKEVFLLEDACEAHGSEFKENFKVGTLGIMSAFSMYVSHIMTSIEGGMVTTNSKKYYDKLKSLRNHGRKYDIPHYSRYKSVDGNDRRFEFDKIGFNFKMNEIEAIIGIQSLKNIEKNIEKRIKNFSYFYEELKDIEKFLSYGGDPLYAKISPHAFPITIMEDASFTREDFMKYLAENGIETRTLFQSISSIGVYGIKEKFS